MDREGVPALKFRPWKPLLLRIKDRVPDKQDHQNEIRCVFFKLLQLFFNSFLIYGSVAGTLITASDGHMREIAQ